MKIYIFSPPFAECVDCFASRTHESPCAGYRLAAEIDALCLPSALSAMRKRYGIRISPDGKANASASDLLAAFRSLMDAEDFETAAYEVVTHLSGGRATMLSRKECVDIYAEERKIRGKFLSILDTGTPCRSRATIEMSDKWPEISESTVAIFKGEDCEEVIKRIFDMEMELMPKIVSSKTEYLFVPDIVAAWFASCFEHMLDKEGVKCVTLFTRKK